MSQGVIELNGKRYDAITGEYLGKSSVVPSHILQSHGKVIDGFVRPSHPGPKAKPVAPAAVSTTEPPTPAPAGRPIPDVVRRHSPSAPKHLKAHHPERAKTLMRRSVQKPEFSLKPAIKPQAPAEIMAKPHSAIMHKRTVASVDPHRLERAAQTARHEAVRHFHPPHRPVPSHTVAHVPAIAVRPAPEHASGVRVIPAQVGHAHKTHDATHPNHPKQRHADIFEAAIAHATSHQQPAHRPHQRVRRRLVNTLAIVGTLLLIGGFVGYLNLPQLQLQVASMQVGFGASMPAYTPAGYALEGGIQRSGGTISLSFRSGDSKFRITQQSSNWNSQTLLDNTLALNAAHQTVQKNGQTVYIYDGGKSATWVNGGIRYDLTGNADLSKDEIATIATSL